MDLPAQGWQPFSGTAVGHPVARPGWQDRGLHGDRRRPVRAQTGPGHSARQPGALSHPVRTCRRQHLPDEGRAIRGLQPGNAGDVRLHARSDRRRHALSVLPRVPAGWPPVQDQGSGKNHSGLRRGNAVLRVAPPTLRRHALRRGSDAEHRDDRERGPHPCHRSRHQPAQKSRGGTAAIPPGPDRAQRKPAPHQPVSQPSSRLAGTGRHPERNHGCPARPESCAEYCDLPAGSGRSPPESGGQSRVQGGVAATGRQSPHGGKPERPGADQQAFAGQQ